MRTAKQIENLRKAFILMPFGAYTICMSDEEINTMADRLQAQINNSEHYTWTIFTKTEGEDVFVEEPLKVYASLNAISEKCKNLLSKYDKLSCIKITSEGGYTYVFNRKGERHESKPENSQ